MESQDEFETNIVAWCLQNPEEFWALSDRLGPQAFRSEPWRTVWPLLHQGYQHHSRFPTLVEVGSYLARLNVDPLARMPYVGAVRTAMVSDVGAYTAAEVTSWAAQNELLRVAEKIMSGSGPADLAARLDYCERQLENIRLLMGERSLGVRFDPLDFSQWWADIEEDYGAPPITSGFSRVDKKLRDGGIRPTMVLIVGPTGGAKTTLGLRTARANLRTARGTFRGRPLGSRWVEYFLDDNKGEIRQRVTQAFLQRALRAPDYDPGNRERIAAAARHVRETQFPGEFYCFDVEPDKFGPHDFVRHLLQLQAGFRAEDEKLIAQGADIPRPGCVAGIGIDTGDQVKAVHQGRNNSDWYVLEKTFSALSSIPKRIKAPIFLKVQGNQESVGASQITLRNVGGSFGKCKPAKLIMAAAQTVMQSQTRRTIDWNEECWQANRSALWDVDFTADRNTAWEPLSLCIIKNTAGSGDIDAGIVKNVIVPLYVSFASSRVIENFSAPDEMMRTDKKTAIEEKEAYSSGPPSRAGKRGSNK